MGLGPAGELQREVVKMVEKGWIKTVPIDSEFGMEEAIEVSFLFAGVGLDGC